jgi:hypothetical protein
MYVPSFLNDLPDAALEETSLFCAILSKFLFFKLLAVLSTLGGIVPFYAVALLEMCNLFNNLT